MDIREMTSDDWPQVESIYAAGIATGHATFETEAPDWEHFDALRLRAHRFVAHNGPAVCGWIAVTPVSSRRAYSGVVEHSVYVDPSCAGRGVGSALLRALCASTDAADIWTIQSSIFPENTASLALHERAGFRVIGTRERIAQHHGIWRDTVFIERRRR